MPAAPTVQQVSFSSAPLLLAHRLPRNGVIVIGGPSGSGKSTLAARLLELLPSHAAHLKVEDSYLGWPGRHAGVRLLERAMWRANQLGHADLITWDWLSSGPGGSSRLLALSRLRAPLVIEGVEADSALGHLANLVVRVEAPPPLRAQRVAARDGYWSQLWDRWAAEEEAQAHATRLIRPLGGRRAGVARSEVSMWASRVSCTRTEQDPGPLPLEVARRYFRVVPCWK